MDDLELQRLEAVADAAQAVNDWYAKAKPWLHACPDPPSMWLMEKLRYSLEAVAGRLPEERRAMAWWRKKWDRPERLWEGTEKEGE